MGWGNNKSESHIYSRGVEAAIGVFATFFLPLPLGTREFKLNLEGWI